MVGRSSLVAGKCNLSMLDRNPRLKYDDDFPQTAMIRVTLWFYICSVSAARQCCCCVASAFVGLIIHFLSPDRLNCRGGPNMLKLWHNKRLGRQTTSSLCFLIQTKSRWEVNGRLWNTRKVVWSNTFILTHLMIQHYLFPSSASAWSCLWWFTSHFTLPFQNSYCERLHLSDCNFGFFLQPLG